MTTSMIRLFAIMAMIGVVMLFAASFERDYVHNTLNSVSKDSISIFRIVLISIGFASVAALWSLVIWARKLPKN